MVFYFRSDDNGDPHYFGFERIKEMIANYKKAIKYKKQFSDLGFKNLKDSDIAPLEKLQESLDNLRNQEYAEGTDLLPETNAAAEEFIKNNADMSDSAKNAAKAMGNADTNIGGLKSGLKAMNVSSRIAAVGLNILSAAGNMLIMALVSAGINWFINDVINANQKIRESAEQTMETYKEAEKNFKSYRETIDDISGDYETLAKGVDALGNNVSLNTEEYARYNEITSKIAEMFPSMVRGYTDEGNAILTTKGSLEELNKSYEEYVRLKHQEADKGSKDVWSNFNNILNTNSKEIEVVDYVKELMSSGEIERIYQEKRKSAINDWDARFDTRDAVKTMVRKKTGVAVGELGPVFNEHDIDIPKYLESTIAERNEMLKTLTSSISTVETELDKGTKEVTSVLLSHFKGDIGDYSKLPDETKSAVDAIVSSFDSSFFKEQDFKNIEDAQAYIQEKIINPLKSTSNQSQLNYAFNLQTRFNDNEVSVGAYQTQINSILSNIVGMDDDTIKQIKILFGIESEDSTIEQAINRITQAGFSEDVARGFVNSLTLADVGKILTSEFDKAAKGVDSRSIRGLAEAFKNATANMSDEFDLSTYTEQIDTLQEDLKTLQSALQSIESGEFSPTDAIDLAQKFPSLTPYINDMEALKGKLRDLINEKPDSLITTLTEFRDTKNLTDAQKESINGLISVLQGLNSTTEQTATSPSKILGNIEGISSAYQTVFNSIKEYHETGILSTSTLKSLIELEPKYIDCLVGENGQLQLNTNSYVELTKAQLENYKISKALEEINTINALKTVEEAVQYASSLKMQAAETLADNLDAQWQSAMSQAYIKDMASGTTAYTDAVRAGYMATQKQSAIVDLYSQSLDKNAQATYGATEATNEQTEALENQKEALESQKEAIEKTKQAAEDRKAQIESEKSALSELIDLEKERIKQIKEDEKEALEKKKDQELEQIDLLITRLEKEKELHDYQKSISEKTEDVASANLSMVSASLDDSSAGRANYKEAKDTYEEKRDDLSEAQYDHRYDLQKEAFDNYREYVEQKYSDSIQVISDYLSNDVQLYKDACASIDNDNGALYNQLLFYVQTYTTKTNAEFNYMWTNAQNALTNYNNLHLSTFGLMDYLQGQIYTIQSQIYVYTQQISILDGQINTIGDNISSVSSAISITADGIYNTAGAVDTYGNSLSTANGKAQEFLDNLYKIAQMPQYGDPTKYQSYIDYKGIRFQSTASASENLTVAVSDLMSQIRQYTGQSVSFDEVKKNIKRFASGTRSASGGLSIVDEEGSEWIPAMKPSVGGRYTILPQGNPVFNKVQTNELWDFASNPSKYLANQMSNGSLSSSIPSTAIIRQGDNINTSLHLNIQGDADASTIRALKRESNNIINKAVNRFKTETINIVDKNRIKY